MSAISQSAVSLAGQAYSLVDTAMTDSMTRAVEAYDAAVRTIDDLGAVDVALPGDLTWVESWVSGVGILGVPSPAVPAYGVVPGINDPTLMLTDPIAPVAGTAPVFDKPVVTLTIPAAPPPIDLGVVPTAPPVDLSGIVFPADPVLAYPVMDTLDAIVVPGFVMPALPTFAELAPDFTAALPNTNAIWTETDYAPDLLDEVKAVILRLMDGNAIPPAVEQAMWDRARQREDANVQKATADAFNDWAARGFSMPPGMLVEQVNAARQDALLKTNTLSRDVAIKHAEWMQENVKFSVQQGLAYEGLLINLWENAVKRAFEFARLSVEMSVKLYDVQVAAFNARVAAYKTKADVWKTEIEVAMMQLDAYKIQLEAEKLKGELNQQKVSIYTARMNALQVVVDVYKAQMSGVQTRVDTIKTAIEAYSVQVKAYSEWLNAQKVQFEAYDIQVKAETSKATFLETATRAFAAEVQAFSAIEDVKVKRYEGETRVLATKVDAYQAKIGAEKAKVDAAVESNRLKVQEFTALIEKYRADQNVNIEQARLNASVSENYVRSRIAYMEAKVREWGSKADALVKKADLQSRGLQAAAHAATGLANATMSAIHYGTTFSGSGAVQAQQSLTGTGV
jgi:hypothetical protein